MTNDFQEAAVLASRMHGAGWVPETNDEKSGGWRWRVRNGMLAVYPKTSPSRGTRYQCLLSWQHDEDDGGAGFWFDETVYDDPNEAVRQQLVVARRFVQRVDQVVSALEAVVSSGG